MKNYLMMIVGLPLASCSYQVQKLPDENTKTSLSFAALTASVFAPKCGQCHGAEWVGDYDATVAIAPGIAARIQSTDPSFMMPKPGAPALTGGEKAAILDWIARGTPRGEGAGTPATPPPGPSPGPNPGTPVNFARMQAEVFPKCMRCHGSDFDTYEHARPLFREMEFRLGDSAQGTMDQMPPMNRPQLTHEERALALEWLRAGAPEF